MLEHLGNPVTRRWEFGPSISWHFPTRVDRARVRATEAGAAAALARFDGVVLDEGGPIHILPALATPALGVPLLVPGQLLYLAQAQQGPVFQGISHPGFILPRHCGVKSQVIEIPLPGPIPAELAAAVAQALFILLAHLPGLACQVLPAWLLAPGPVKQQGPHAVPGRVREPLLFESSKGLLGLSLGIRPVC